VTQKYYAIHALTKL